MQLRNKRGSVIIFSMMIAIVVIILGLALSPAISEITTIARNNVTVENGINITGMDCNNESIDNFVKAACVSTDISLFYFISAVLLIGFAVIGAKVAFGGE